MLPFCLVLQEDDAGSRIVSPDYRQVAATDEALAARVLARVLDFQIRQVLCQLVGYNRYQQAVEEGGGEYRGVQPGSTAKDLPDLVLFDDPATHTTLALPIGNTPITAAAVRKKIARSRSRFLRQHETDIPAPARQPAVRAEIPPPANISKGERYETAL